MAEQAQQPLRLAQRYCAVCQGCTLVDWEVAGWVDSEAADWVGSEVVGWVAGAATLAADCMTGARLWI